MSIINPKIIRSQVYSLMSMLNMNESGQKITLDSWGYPAQNKDDLAEELHRLISVINTNENVMREFNCRELDIIGLIDKIFARYSDGINIDFWQFHDKRYSEEWSFIRTLSGEYLSFNA